MTIRNLEKPQRQGYFDRVSQHLGATQARIELIGNDVGAQLEADWVGLVGLAYDPRNDELEIATDALDHHISRPREVYVDDGVEGLHSVEIIDDAGNKQIIRLKQPLRLPHNGTAGRSGLHS